MNTLKPFLKNKNIIQIVYYGPAMSGKTTNLQCIYESPAIEVKGELVNQLINEYDRLLFFDFVMPEIRTIGKKVPTFRIQWLGGAVYSAKSRQDVLVGANAVVFVADSLSIRFEENIKVLTELTDYLRNQEYSLKAFPWVIQYTKRDLPEREILPVQYLQRQLNQYNVPYFEAVPVQRVGVFETLMAILQLVIANARKS